MSHDVFFDERGEDIMSVIRVNKNRNYTCMSNEHLQDKNLSLKAKGLLSLVLTLPDAWKYSIRGLASICKESAGCISAVLNELEEAGYLKRSQLRDESGRLSEMEYIFSESPCADNSLTEQSAPPYTEIPHTDSPCTEKPDAVNPNTEIPCMGNAAQSNTNQSTTNQSITDQSIINPIKNPSINTQPSEEQIQMAYAELIRDNIDLETLMREFPENIGILENLYSLMLELVLSKQKEIVISGKSYPPDLVKSKLLKLKAGDIRTVMNGLKENLPRIRYQKKYMTTVLFNALNTTAKQERIGRERGLGKKT